MLDLEAALGLGIGSRGDAEHPRNSEPHGFRTLFVPKVLLPPGRVDLVGKVSEVVKAAFPLVASAFRPEKLVVEGDWGMANGARSRCSRLVQMSKVERLLRFA